MIGYVKVSFLNQSITRCAGLANMRQIESTNFTNGTNFYLLIREIGVVRGLKTFAPR